MTLIISVQTAVVIATSFFCGMAGMENALSAFLGGVSAWVPNCFFAWYFFAKRDQRSPREVVYAFYIGEMLKLLMSVIMALIFVSLLPVPIMPFLIGLGMACFSVIIAVPLIIKQQQGVNLS